MHMHSRTDLGCQPTQKGPRHVPPQSHSPLVLRLIVAVVAVVVFSSSNTFNNLQLASTQLKMSSNRAIVVGGGLAGLSAAHTLLERGASVLLLDKQGYVHTLRSLQPSPLAMLTGEFV